MTLSYTALQTAISNASSNTTTAVGNKLKKGTSSTPAVFPGGFSAYSAGAVIKKVSLPDPSALTHDYRLGSIVQVTGTANITGITLTNVPFVGPSSNEKMLVPFTLIFLPSGSTTPPSITSINGVTPNFNKGAESTSVSDPEYVIVTYAILMPDSGAADVFWSKHSHL